MKVKVAAQMFAFHHSGLRTAELQKVAEENKLTLLSIPKAKDIRWTEWNGLIKCL